MDDLRVYEALTTKDTPLRTRLTGNRLRASSSSVYLGVAMADSGRSLP
jgi:hypothetical protein